MPEGPSLKDCFDARVACQKERREELGNIFREISAINKLLAEKKGEDKAKAHAEQTTKHGPIRTRFNWREVTAVIVIVAVAVASAIVAAHEIATRAATAVIKAGNNNPGRQQEK